MAEANSAGRMSRRANTPPQNLEREQGATQGYTVGRRHARTRAARHEESTLFIGELDTIREYICNDRAGLLGRAFTSQRGPHADDDD